MASSPSKTIKLNSVSNASNKHRLYSVTAILAVLILFINIMSPSNSNVDSGDYSSSNSLLRTSFSLSNKNQIDVSNKFSYTDKNSPYEQIWINTVLPDYAKKRQQFQDIESTISPEEQICYLHIGKTGGSSVGCSLGFNLHCEDGQPPLEGLLPQRATRMFHADLYDCHDDSAYFLFMLRNPIERLKSAFLYDRPKSETALKKKNPQYYTNRKALYLDCFGKMENLVQDGLKKDGKASDECKLVAKYAVTGEKHYSCHMTFNYQFHLEGIPEDGKIIAIRKEHMTDDWNSIEHFIGGPKEIIDPKKANETIGIMNPSKKNYDYKWLSEESITILCRQMCNEIVTYKKILRRSLNLNYPEIEKSITELRETCGTYADVEEGDCSSPMPDIQEKIINTRGYADIVMEGSYKFNKNELESKSHTIRQDTLIEAKALMDDDDFELPYSV